MKIVGVNKKIKNKAIVGDCLYNELSKGKLSFSTSKLVLPYILLDIMNCEGVHKEELISMYNHLTRKCLVDIPTVSFPEPSPSLGALQLESLGFILLESGGYIILE